MIKFKFFTGVIQEINDLVTNSNNETGCYKLLTLQTNEGIVNFIINPLTYIVENKLLNVDDKVIVYYDANRPVILIYPPQYTAIVIAKVNPSENIKVDYFNEELISSDGMLKIDVTPLTKITQENGQLYSNKLNNRNWVVIYQLSTKSIPALTYPKKIIVLCRTDYLQNKKSPNSDL